MVLGDNNLFFSNMQIVSLWMILWMYQDMNSWIRGKKARHCAYDIL